MVHSAAYSLSIVANTPRCTLSVNDDDKALYCDGCDQWIRVSCDQYISESIVLMITLLNFPSPDPWYSSTALVLI